MKQHIIMKPFFEKKKKKGLIKENSTPHKHVFTSTESRSFYQFIGSL